MTQLPEILTADELTTLLATSEHPRLARELVEAAVGLIADDPALLDLKIATAALQEMREAFTKFAPYRGIRKVTVFGSARVKPNDALYLQAKEVSRCLAAKGWMIITGAGPGIMEAAMEGAGREHSFGVNIRLPFEQGANAVIAGDEKLVSMKYFFTRKLMLMKESSAFVCLPGGFGTLDETFELITLTQTGKGVPVPIVFLDTPGDPYWEHVHNFAGTQLVTRGLVAAGDLALYRVTDSPDVAVEEITRFFNNYHSQRYVGDVLFLRLHRAPTATQLAALNAAFGDLCARGTITASAPHPAEIADDDELRLHRLRFRFDKRQYGRLRQLIDAMNAW